VNRRDVGCVFLQESCTFNVSLRSLRALVAALLSVHAGALSSGSSVRLKSPSSKLICWLLLFVSEFLIVDQKL